MGKYIYRPVRFYVICYVLTWLCWFLAIALKERESFYIFMILGLIAPAVTAIVTVFASKSKALKQDLKRKIIGFYRIRPFNIIIAILVFILIVAISILTSTFFGQSLDQFRFTEDFSFSIGGAPAILSILLASVIEEIGWRGYGEDSVAAYHSWFIESIIFGCLWAIWHLPLFWIDGTYHFGLRELGIGYMINFLISVVPLGFLTTWVYVKNSRSMLACIIFHLFVNIMQEKIAMTPQTKCVETLVITLAAIIIILCNKQMFFEKKHIGNFLKE